DLSWTFAFDLADDRHVGADARSHSRPRRGLVMRHHPAHDLGRTYRCVSILLSRAALRADQHVHLLFPPVMRVQCAKALWHMPPRHPALDCRTNMISGPAPGGNATPLGPSDPPQALVELPADS